MIESPSAVEALLFDVFGTVVDWRTSLIKMFEAFGRERQLTADWATLVDDWRAAYQPSMDTVRRGERPFVTLDVLHRESLDRLLRQHGLGRLEENDRRWLSDGWHRLDPWPDVVRGLTRLKRKYVIATLSNGGVGLLVDMAKYGGLPWDAIFSADLFQRFKPDPATYVGSAELLRRAPAAVMLVAAHNYDLIAARSFGLRTAFIPRTKEYGPRQVKDFAPEDKWNVVASDFEDLASQLGA
jgi:2-haloacid dehalogenase